MLEARTVGQRRVQVRKVGEPSAPGAGEAMIDVAAVGICGSDLHMYLGDDPYTTYPIRQGHEFSGRIKTLGPGYHEPLVRGQLVAVRPTLPCSACIACRRGRPNCCVRLRVLGVHVDGAFAERLTVPVANLYDAEGLTPEEAAFSEPVSIGLQMVYRSGLAPGDTALILGAGPIGQSILLAARGRGARLIAADRLAGRLDLARNTGADDTIDVSTSVLDDALGRLTQGDGPTVVFEATGVASVIEQAIDVVAATGTIVIAGTPAQMLSVSPTKIVSKELNLHGSRNNTDSYAEAVALVRANRARVAPLITHRWPLDQTMSAMEHAIAHPNETQKVAILVAS